MDVDGCEIVTLNSLVEGVGTVLLSAVRTVAMSSKCRRVWLITTNDNLHALRFYQRNGFSLVALHRNALDLSRRLKPEIPLTGQDGIPLRDELELEVLL
jgi:GNAT superfamily N-acetyltransferase